MSNRLVEEHVDNDITNLRKLFPNYDNLPAPAQRALLDMVYNIGYGGLRGYPNKIAAINRGDWERAARESRRNGISDERNARTADLFRQAGGSR